MSLKFVYKNIDYINENSLEYALDHCLYIF